MVSGAPDFWLRGDYIELINIINRIKLIDQITKINDIVLIDDITNIGTIGNAQVATNPMRNARFTSSFNSWHVPNPAKVTLEDDAVFGKRVRLENCAAVPPEGLYQYFHVSSEKYPTCSFLAYKPAVGGADIIVRFIFMDGTYTTYTPALTNAWARYSFELHRPKIIASVDFRDAGGICYLQLPQLIEVPDSSRLGAPWSITASALGNNTIKTPTVNYKLRVKLMDVWNNGTATITTYLRFGAAGTARFKKTLSPNTGYIANLIGSYWEGADDEELIINLSAAGTVNVTVFGEEIRVLG